MVLSSQWLSTPPPMAPSPNPHSRDPRRSAGILPDPYSAHPDAVDLSSIRSRWHGARAFWVEVLQLWRHGTHPHGMRGQSAALFKTVIRSLALQLWSAFSSGFTRKLNLVRLPGNPTKATAQQPLQPSIAHEPKPGTNFRTIQASASPPVPLGTSPHGSPPRKFRTPESWGESAIFAVVERLNNMGHFGLANTEDSEGSGRTIGRVRLGLERRQKGDG